MAVLDGLEGPSYGRRLRCYGILASRTYRPEAQPLSWRGLPTAPPFAQMPHPTPPKHNPPPKIRQFPLTPNPYPTTTYKIPTPISAPKGTLFHCKHSPNPSCASCESDLSCRTCADCCRSLRHRIYLHASGGWNRKSNACFDGLGEYLLSINSKPLHTNTLRILGQNAPLKTV